MTSDLPNAATYTSLASQAGSLAALRILWSGMYLKRAALKDIFKSISGKPGSGRPCVEVYENGKGKNTEIRFRTHSGVGMRPVIGDSKRAGLEGQIQWSSFAVKLDDKWGGVAATSKHTRAIGMEFDGLSMEVLGDWRGQLLQDEGFVSYRNLADRENTMYAGNKSNIDQLLSADVLSTAVVDHAKAIAEQIGAIPVMTSKDPLKNDVNMYIFLGTHVAFDSLSLGQSFDNALQNAGPRSYDNILFKGGLVPWRGSLLMRHQLVESPMIPVGSPCMPKAYLGEAITAGSSVITVKGGRARELVLDPQPHWFQSFLGYDWQFIEGQTPVTNTTARYFIIYNLLESTDGAGDAGKWCIYKYTSGNTGPSITITERLGPSTTGAQKATVGSVAWDADVHTTDHGVGSVVIQCNAKGVAIGFSLCLGQNSLYRGFGDPISQRTRHVDDHERMMANGILSCWGQSAYYDVADRPCGYVLVWHAVNHPTVPLPAVTV